MPAAPIFGNGTFRRRIRIALDPTGPKPYTDAGPESPLVTPAFDFCLFKACAFFGSGRDTDRIQGTDGLNSGGRCSGPGEDTEL